MEFRGASIDDILHDVLSEILKSGKKQTATKGDNYELLSVSVHLTDIRARLSRSFQRGRLISPFGELFWYLNGTNELKNILYYIKNYDEFSDDGSTVFGAYGPRIFEGGILNPTNAFNGIVSKLRRKPSSRQAIIPILRADDFNYDTKDLPCTVALQFFVRENALHMHTFMRSNDVYLGFIHDGFCFTFIQEILACYLNLDLGEYCHHVSSLHLYERDVKSAETYLSEGYQSLRKCQMPEIPKTDIEKDLKCILQVEEVCRQTEKVDYQKLSLPQSKFWKDIAHLFYIYRLYRNRNSCVRQTISELNVDDFYLEYLKKYK